MKSAIPRPAPLLCDRQALHGPGSTISSHYCPPFRSCC